MNGVMWGSGGVRGEGVLVWPGQREAISPDTDS